MNWSSSPVVRHDSTQENMKVLWSYLEKFGRPLACLVRVKCQRPTEYEGAVELPGEIRSAVGILHGQGKPFSDGRKAQAGRTWSREGCRGDAADANRTCVAGTGDRLDCSAFCSGQREGGEEFRNGTGSAG